MADTLKRCHSFLALVLGRFLDFLSLFSGINWAELKRVYMCGFWRNMLW